jgi:(2Fe-2S) ferredoxin
MEPFRYHAFVCTQEKGEDATCCSGGGSAKVLEVLHRELGAAGLSDEVQVSSCGCLGICESGPVMILYPNGTWYTKLTPEAIPEIVASHFLYDEPVFKFVREDRPAMKAEILEHRRKYLEMLKKKAAERRSEEPVQQASEAAAPVNARVSARPKLPPCRRGKVGYGF